MPRVLMRPHQQQEQVPDCGPGPLQGVELRISVLLKSIRASELSLSECIKCSVICQKKLYTPSIPGYADQDGHLVPPPAPGLDAVHAGVPSPHRSDITSPDHSKKYLCLFRLHPKGRRYKLDRYLQDRLDHCDPV